MEKARRPVGYMVWFFCRACVHTRFKMSVTVRRCAFTTALIPAGAQRDALCAARCDDEQIVNFTICLEGL